MASQTAQTAQRKGSCLCDAIKYTLTGSPLFESRCNCNNCAKASGSVFGCFTWYPRKNLTLTPPNPPTLTTYRDAATTSGNPLLRSFCSACGSSVIVRREGDEDGNVVIAAGTLEERDSFRPNLEFFTACRAEWVTDVEGCKTFVGNPPRPAE